MLKSKLVVDLPSVETNRRMGPIEWVRSLFGAKLDLRSGESELTVGAFSLVEGLTEAFAAAGVTDAISFLVDKKVVYADTNDVPDDLPLVAKAAEEAGVLDRSFTEMHLVLAHKTPTIHAIFDCEIASHVVLGQAEMEVDVSARLTELAIKPGETAEQYAARVKAFAAEDDSFDPARRELDALVDRVADALRAKLVGATVTRDPAVVQIIRPDRRQIGKFNDLPFGADVRAPEYRAVPTMQRYGAYADPFYYYYYDPYYDFMSWVLVDGMMHDAMWHSNYVQVVEPSGALLFTGDQAANHANDSWFDRDAVGFTDGGVSVAPDAISGGGSDGGSGGSWWDSVGGGAGSGSDGGSSCSSSGGSSCSSSGGSSCSSGGSSCASSGGSSCGSSCSGGSSCGSSCGGGSSCSS